MKRNADEPTGSSKLQYLYCKLQYLHSTEMIPRIVIQLLIRATSLPQEALLSVDKHLRRALQAPIGRHGSSKVKVVE